MTLKLNNTVSGPGEKILSVNKFSISSSKSPSKERMGIPEPKPGSDILQKNSPKETSISLNEDALSL